MTELSATLPVKYVVDDTVCIDDLQQCTHHGPYDQQPVEPWPVLNEPIENSLVPKPAYEITDFFGIPGQTECRKFQAFDTLREVFGNTDVYLIIACDINDPSAVATPSAIVGVWLEGKNPTRIHFQSQDASAGASTSYDVVTGDLATLHGGAAYSTASCLGLWVNTPAEDSGPDPDAGQGRYYLVRGKNSCGAGTYGDSSVVPDPRDALDSSSPCP